MSVTPNSAWSCCERASVMHLWAVRLIPGCCTCYENALFRETSCILVSLSNSRDLVASFLVLYGAEVSGVPPAGSYRCARNEKHNAFDLRCIKFSGAFTFATLKYSYYAIKDSVLRLIVCLFVETYVQCFDIVLTGANTNLFKG